MTKRWHVAMAVALVATQLNGLSVAVAAPTTEAEQQSRRTFEKAEAHFRAGLFAEALSEYQAGYDLVPLPGFLINIAQCQRRLGELNQALVTYRKFIMVAPDSRYVPDVKNLIEELQTLVQDAENASASASGRAQGQEEDPLEPVPYSAVPRETSRTDLVSAPTAALPKESKTRWWLWGTAAATVVVGVTLAAFVLKDPGTTTVSSGSLGTLRR
jgi:tetratricopeptide (TPR) repeat protein